MTQINETPPGGEGFAKIFPGGKHREINTKPLKNQAAFTEDEEAAIASDRRFFRRFQERRHYIRPACQGEVATLHKLGASTPPTGCAWFTVVKKVAPQCRMRRWIIADARLIHHEASERAALAIWEALGGPSEVRP
jgi:hypothetical protein